MSSSEDDLDRALRALPAEPPAGFEARLMERLAAAPRPRRFHSGLAALALCAALASAIALMVIVRSPQPPHASQSRRAAARAIAPAPPRLTPQPARTARVAVIRRPLPRRRQRLGAVAHRFPAQFPTPTPPTASELALLRFVRTAPPAVVAAFRGNLEGPRAERVSVAGQGISVRKFRQGRSRAAAATPIGSNASGVQNLGGPAAAAAPDLQPIKIAAIEIKPLPQSPQGETEP